MIVGRASTRDSQVFLQKPPGILGIDARGTNGVLLSRFIRVARASVAHD